MRRRQQTSGGNSSRTHSISALRCFYTHVAYDRCAGDRRIEGDYGDRDLDVVTEPDRPSGHPVDAGYCDRPVLTQHVCTVVFHDLQPTGQRRVLQVLIRSTVTKP